MRTIILSLFMVSVLSTAQAQNSYLKLFNTSGMQLNGDAVTKGFERWITVLSSLNGGKNNTEITFTMNVSGACADLRNASLNNGILQKGELSKIQVTPDGRHQVVSTIKMENIKVVSYSENGSQATVTLRATRIGWIYYQQSNKGVWTVSNKTSFDSETGGPWRDF